MKLEISEDLYFSLLKTANGLNMSVNEHILTMQEKYANTEQDFLVTSQVMLDNFRAVLFMTIQEILDSQKNLANSDEGTPEDMAMVEVLNVLFARATRDNMIVQECLDIFTKKMRNP